MAERSRLTIWTRFNMPMAGRGRDGLWKSRVWTNRRMHMYLAYTLWTLERQHDTNFDMLLQCWPGVQRFIEPFIPELGERGVLPVFDNGKAYFRELAKEYAFVDMFRLDSDDLLAVNATREIKKGFEHRRAVYCKSGFIWDIRTNQMLKFSKSNPGFCGVRTPTDNVTNIMSAMNGQLVRGVGTVRARFKRTFKPRRLPRGLFCMTVHGDNNRQKRIRQGDVNRKRVLKRFGFTAKGKRK